MLSLAVGISILLVALVVRDAYYKRNYRLPPGPPGLPLLGNLLQLPRKLWYRKLTIWSEQYGPFYTFWIGSQPYVVCSSVKVAADVLDGMSAVTSDRPALIKAREFYFRESMMIWLDRTLLWRRMRRAAHTSLNVRFTLRFTQIQAQDAAYLTLGLLQHPEKPFHEHVRRFSGSVIARALYGGDAVPLLGLDPSKRIEQLMDEVMQKCLPQNSMVDMMPFLKPLIQRVKRLRKQADDWFEAMDQEGSRLYDIAFVTDSSEATTIVHDINTRLQKHGLTKHEAVWAALSMFMAGQETTHSALRFFGLAMLHHPDVMETAQSQLDAVCGGRAPTFQDRECLPYIDAIVKETLRWRPALPLGLPHTASEDFEYQGYVIRKGTTIIDHIWSQTRDSFIYSNPEVFDPSRFLDNSGRLRPNTPGTHLDQLGFGHGRRVCPGRDFAIDSMFIACAYMLWAFRFEWPVDEYCRSVTRGMDDMWDSALIVTPKRFQVVLKARFERLEEQLLAGMTA
ncbi:cytochrome P450 [Calocera viscosa TUFC12733]|uniref:Cytochrome P450 n=1 Tax=Calocera viscosa (strain TUFC12733) TaxID=1330018 RepID=A0A167QH82_CALVF|nr:cytochrome P450 [Calocera viscosa TUFC12733]